MPDKSHNNSGLRKHVTLIVQISCISHLGCDAFPEDAVLIRDSNHMRAIAAALKR